MIRIACCGGWQPHAKDFPMKRAVTHCSDIPHKFVAVWDDDEERGIQWASEMGCPFVSDYEAILSNPEIDGVIITAATTKHTEMAIKAALAGKHIYIEKALTTTAKEAYAIRKAVKESGIHFTVSDPPARRPWVLFLRELAQSGKLGTITSARVHTAHDEGLGGWGDIYYDKSLSGGGAMIDMGYHALHIMNLLLGKPIAATAVFKPVTERGKQFGVDENSVAIVEYEGNRLGIAETGWTSGLYQHGLSIYGTKGFASVVNDKISWCLTGEEPHYLTEDDLPTEAYPLRYWMLSIVNDTPNTIYDIDDAVEVTELEEIVHLAAASGKRVEISAVKTE